MKIYITRHSLTTWNEEKRLQGWKNSDLTKQGLEDAKRLGNYLKNQSFDGIYSSPLKRAKETAQLIFPNKTIIEDDRLKEMNFGDYEGKFIDEDLYRQIKNAIGRKYEAELISELDTVKPEDIEAWIEMKKDDGVSISKKAWAKAMAVKDGREWKSNDDYLKNR